MSDDWEARAQSGIVTKVDLDRMREELAALRYLMRNWLPSSDYLTLQPALESFQLLISAHESVLERLAKK